MGQLGQAREKTKQFSEFLVKTENRLLNKVHLEFNRSTFYLNFIFRFQKLPS